MARRTSPASTVARSATGHASAPIPGAMATGGAAAGVPTSNAHVTPKRAPAMRRRNAPQGGRSRQPRNHCGFVLRVVPKTRDVKLRALRAREAGGTLVLDSGATGHFVTCETPLKDTCPASKDVMGAGGDVMQGVAKGRLGPLRDVLQVQGLTQGLVSVGQLAHQHDACVVFSKDRAYVIPQRALNKSLGQGAYTPWIAVREPQTGLYHTNPERISIALRQALQEQLHSQALQHLATSMAYANKANEGGLVLGAAQRFWRHCKPFAESGSTGARQSRCASAAAALATAPP